MLAQKEKEIRKLLKFLDVKNDYYHELFQKSKIDLESDIEDIFYKLPIITKQDIREHYNEYLSKLDLPQFSEFTSGSTGKPVNCVKTSAERTTAGINVWKRRHQWDKEADINNYIYLYDKSTYRKVGNLLNFEKNNMIKCFKRLMEQNPRWLSGPISSFERYAKLIEAGEAEYSYGSIKFLELAGEYASKEQREFVEKVFGAKTINHYGIIESWCIAYECPWGKLHVQNNLFYVETRKPKQQFEDPEIGEITITSFYNKLMPLVRYNIQDYGKVTMEQCECGETSQIITLFGGRTADIIVGTEDVLGELFFKRGIYKLIERYGDCVDGFRVEQTGLKEFLVLIQKGQGFREEMSEIMTKHIKSGLGKDVRVHYEYVSVISPLQSGKMKIFYSHLKESEGRMP